MPMPRLSRPTRPRWRRPRRPVPFWLLAVALAVVTALTVVRFVGRAEADAARWGSTRATLVALRDVDAGAVLGPDDAEVRLLPAALVPPGALAEATPGATTAWPIHEGEAVLAARLAPAGLSVTAARLAPGTVGVAVPTGPGALRLEPGDVVDVLATLEPGAGGQADPTVVVARGAAVIDVAEDAVAVAVDEGRATRVAFAVTAGVVTLVLGAGR